MSSIFDSMAATFVQHLGETVDYRHGPATISLQGFVEMPSMMAGGLGEDAPDSIETQISVSFAAADLPVGFASGDTVALRGRSYAVKAVLPDGRGMVRLQLERL